MLGHRKTKSRGYTIVEVMIFLAVSGFMFIIAANFISGKQATSQFRQGMNSFNTKVQAAINDVSNGFYPSQEDFSCYINPTGQPHTVLNPANKQGENKGCVFMGKIIQFEPSDPKPGTSQDNAFNILTVAGRQYAENSTTLSPETFTEALPVVVLSPDLTDKQDVEWGLKIDRVFSGPLNNRHGIGAIGFFSSFGQYNSGSLTSGAQSTLAVPIPGVGLGQTSTQVANSVSANPDLLDANAAGNPVVTVCLSDNTRYGSLKIGGSNTGDNAQRLATSIKIGTSPADVGCP
jgi:type II secretory pathway pseudopilin PulG